MTEKQVLERIKRAARRRWTKLDLSGENITSLPAKIGKLTKLTELELWDNQLTLLPAEIGKLTKLRELDLRHNQLTSLPAEMAKIVPPPVALADAKKMAEAVATFAPGWSILDCGSQMSAGLHEEFAGKKNVLETHPVSKSRPCVLYKHVDVPQGKTMLHLTVGHHKSGDWNLTVVNGKIKTLLKTTVGSENSKDGWMNVDIELSEYAGSAIDLALLNSAGGGFFEAGYWARIEIVTY